jgi:hypothetical protein
LKRPVTRRVLSPFELARLRTQAFELHARRSSALAQGSAHALRQIEKTEASLETRVASYFPATKQLKKMTALFGKPPSYWVRPDKRWEAILSAAAIQQDWAIYRLEVELAWKHFEAAHLLLEIALRGSGILLWAEANPLAAPSPSRLPPVAPPLGEPPYGVTWVLAVKPRKGSKTPKRTSERLKAHPTPQRIMKTLGACLAKLPTLRSGHLTPLFPESCPSVILGSIPPGRTKEPSRANR